MPCPLMEASPVGWPVATIEAPPSLCVQAFCYIDTFHHFLAHYFQYSSTVRLVHLWSLPYTQLISIDFDACSQELPLGDDHSRRASISLYPDTPSLPAQGFLKILHPSLTYSCTLSFLFTGGRPLTFPLSISLIYTLLVILPTSIRSMWPL